MSAVTHVSGRTWLWFALLAGLVAFLSYAPGLGNEFVAEDFYFLYYADMPLSQAWQEMQTASRIWPLGTLYRWLLFQLNGANPLGYHLFSLVIHTINTLLVLTLAAHLTRQPGTGLIAALVFALYPRQHQPVLWMTASQVLVFTTFGLICLYAWWRFLTGKQRRWYVIAVISLILALLTQEAAVILFPLLLAMAVLSVNWRDRDARRAFWRTGALAKYVPLALALAGYVWISFGGARMYKLQTQELSGSQLAQVGIAGDSYHINGLSLKTAQEFGSYLTYAMYPHIPLRSLDPNVFTALLTGVTGLTLLILFVRAGFVMRLGVLWLGLALLPYVFFAPYGNADRYFYFPSVGFALLTATLLVWVYTRLGQRRPDLARAALATVMLVYGASSAALIQQRIAEWREAGQVAEDLCHQMIDLCPDLRPGETILFAGQLPAGFKQAYIYNGGGIGPHFKLDYGLVNDGLNVYQTTDPAVLAFLKAAPEAANPLPGYHVFLYSDNRLVDKSAAVTGVDQLHPETWFK